MQKLGDSKLPDAGETCVGNKQTLHQCFAIAKPCWCVISFEENFDSADEEEMMNEAGIKSVEAALVGSCQSVFRTCTVPQLALIAVASALAK